MEDLGINYARNQFWGRLQKRGLPKAITLGTRIQLRNWTFSDVKIKQWEFSGVEKGRILLYRREGCILEVGLEDVDWEHHNEPKLED